MLATNASTRADRSTLSGRAVSISAQRISDWKSGRNVPASFEALHPVLVVLFQRVRRRQAPLDRRLLDMRAWRESWTRTHAHIARTRAKPRDHATTVSVEVSDAPPNPLSGVVGRPSGLLALVDRAEGRQLLSVMIRGQAAVDAAVWASMNRHSALLYREEQLAKALDHIDISESSSQTTDALVIDFLRASSNALDAAAARTPAS
jgi:hypothetical protein